MGDEGEDGDGDGEGDDGEFQGIKMVIEEKKRQQRMQAEAADPSQRVSVLILVF